MILDADAATTALSDPKAQNFGTSFPECGGFPIEIPYMGRGGAAVSVRAAHCIYNILCDCLPSDWVNKPPLIWHWTGRDMMLYLKEPEFDFTDGFPASQVMAVIEWAETAREGDKQPEPKAIHAQIWLSTKPYADMVMYFLHELAHCNGFAYDEVAADQEAFRLYKLIARRKAWKETGIKLLVRRTRDKTASVDDRVYSEPARPPADTLPWETER